MDYPWAVVGAKVVCIDDDNSEKGSKWKNGEKPEIGCIYTISSVFLNTNTGNINIRLKELKRNPDCIAKGITGYAIRRFKPLEKKKLPDVLTSLLINPKKRIEADKFDKQGIVA
jgi:hypothetical protein